MPTNGFSNPIKNLPKTDSLDTAKSNTTNPLDPFPTVEGLFLFYVRTQNEAPYKFFIVVTISGLFLFLTTPSRSDLLGANYETGIEKLHSIGLASQSA